jgi:hypothetical protein
VLGSGVTMEESVHDRSCSRPKLAIGQLVEVVVLFPGDVDGSSYIQFGCYT